MALQPPDLVALDMHAEKIRQLQREQQAEEAAKQDKPAKQSPLFTPPQRRASPPIQMQEIYRDSIDLEF